MSDSQKSRIIKSILTIVLVLAFFPTLPSAHATVSWGSPTLVDTHQGLDILPSALQASNGTLWVAWQSTRNNQSTGRTDIIYKTYTNGVWSNDRNLTNSGWNSGPSLIQLSNGTIVAFWSAESGHSFLVYSSSTNGRTWTSPVPITTTSLNDTLTSTAVGRDGTVWVVWTRVNSTNPSNPAVKHVFYKTLKNGIWSNEVKLTNDANQNFGANVMIAKDGLVRVTFSKGAAGNTYQLYQKTYNGTIWTNDTQIVSSSSTDAYPSLIQDRNGTLWLFWSRLIVVSSLVQYYELWGKTSTNLGQRWNPEVQLTPTPGTKIFDSFMPSAVQTNFGVKSLWILYSSNYNVADYDIFALLSTQINNVHDVIVSGVYTSNNLATPWQYPGGLKSVGQTAITTITVTVKNIGDFLENVIMTASLTNTSAIPLGTLHSLVGPGGSVNFYFYWNTTNAKPARYGVSVSITPLAGETTGNLPDDSYSVTNQVHVIPLGDIDQDGGVQITDLSYLLYNYGFTIGSVHNGITVTPYADINNNGVIDIVDVGVVLANFNTNS